MQAIIVSAIVWLAPYVDNRTALKYSRIIVVESEKRDIDPLFVVAQIHLESRFKRFQKSRTNDYGLMQLHVSSTVNSKFINREKLLFNTRRNIKLGIKHLGYWQGYHYKHCTKHDHSWFEHYMWGNRVRGKKQGVKQRKLYQELKDRYYRSLEVS